MSRFYGGKEFPAETQRRGDSGRKWTLIYHPVGGNRRYSSYPGGEHERETREMRYETLEMRNENGDMRMET